MRATSRIAMLLTLAALAPACTQIKQPPSWKLDLVSVDETDETQAGSVGSGPWHNLSADGRVVVFGSKANGTGTVTHVFMRNLETGTLQRVDAMSTGAEFASTSDAPVVNDDGTRVLFAAATPLNDGSGNTRMQIWQRDISDGDLQTPVMLTVNGAGEPGIDASAYDPATQKFWPGLSMSTTGNFFSVGSHAENLTPGTPDDHDTLVFFREVESTPGDFRIMSESSSGAPANDRAYGPTLSADGSIIAYVSEAQNHPGGELGTIMKIYWRRTDEGGRSSLRCLSYGRTMDGSVAMPTGPSISPSISAHGNHVSFASTAENLWPNVERGDGSQYSIYLANNIMGSEATDVTPIFVAGTGVAAADVNAASAPTAAQLRSSVSGDGRFVAFASRCALAEIVDNHATCDGSQPLQLFVFDKSLGTYEQLTFGNADSFAPSMTPDGTAISFVSEATDLPIEQRDENGSADIYVLRFMP